MQQIVKTSERCGRFPSACVHKGNSVSPPWCFTPQMKNRKCFKQKTFGACATGGPYLTNLRRGPLSRRKRPAGQCGLGEARAPSAVPLRAHTLGGLGKGQNFSVASGISSTLLNTVGVSICLLLFHSLGSVCDNSSFFMGFKAIIRS